MPTLIFTPRYTEDSQALWKAAGSLGWRTERLSGWRVPEHLLHVPEPVLYGEALFGPSLAEQLGLELINPAEDWLARLPFDYKLRDIQLSTLGEAKKIAASAFIKPPNDKSFPAGTYRGADLPPDFPEDMPVLVSEIVKWEKEFRCFVLDRTLHSYSIYSRFGELQREAGFESSTEEDAAMQEFLSRLLADRHVDLPPAVVLDIGVIENKGWACVELNAAWGAGIYGCDPASTLEVIRRASHTIAR